MVAASRLSSIRSQTRTRTVIGRPPRKSILRRSQLRIPLPARIAPPRWGTRGHRCDCRSFHAFRATFESCRVAFFFKKNATKPHSLRLGSYVKTSLFPAPQEESDSRNLFGRLTSPGLENHPSVTSCSGDFPPRPAESHTRRVPFLQTFSRYQEKPLESTGIVGSR